MKKIGFLGDAEATTFMGDAMLAPVAGLETVRGKSLDPVGAGGVQVEVGGLHAGGAGRLLVLGDQLIETGGVDGYDGCEGEGVVVVVFETAPQPIRARLRVRTEETPNRKGKRTARGTARIQTTSRKRFASRADQDRERRTFRDAFSGGSKIVRLAGGARNRG